MSTIADKELIINDAGEVLGQRFTFTNGNVFEALVSELSEAMVYRNAIHGFGQKLGDSYAGAKTKGLTVDECEQGVRDLWDAMKAGTFSGGRSTGGKLFEAFKRWALAGGKSEDEIREAFADLTDDQKKELRKAAPIKAKLAEIDAERAAAAAALAKGGDDEDLESKYF